MSRPFKNILIFSLSLGILLNIASILMGYEKVLDFLIMIISPNKKDFILAKINIIEFYYLHVLILSIMTSALFVIMRFHSKIQNISIDFFTTIKHTLKQIFFDFCYGSLKYIIIIPVLLSIFSSIYFPVSHDEAFTFLHFTINSPLTILTNYPSPNNHFFHSLFTHFFFRLGIFSDLVNIRIPSIIISFLTYSLSYVLLKKYYNEKIAITVAGVYSMLFMTVYYSYLSRGYALILLFFIISFFASHKIILNNGMQRHWLIFCISNILGFFTMPSYLYPYIVLNTLILINNKKHLNKLIVYNFITLLSVLLLYTPVFIFEGIGSIINNSTVNPISRSIVIRNLPNHLLKTFYEITGYENIFSLVIFFLSSITLIIKKNKYYKIISLVFLLAPFVLLFTHSVLYFSRLFNYYAFVIVFILAISIDTFFMRLSKKLIVIIVLIMQFALALNFMQKIRHYEHEEFNLAYNAVNKEILKPQNSYLINSSMFGTNFNFEMKSRNFKFSNINEIYPPLDCLSADTVERYNYVIIDVDKDHTKIKHPAIKTKFVNIYHNNLN